VSIVVAASVYAPFHVVNPRFKIEDKNDTFQVFRLVAACDMIKTYISGRKRRYKDNRGEDRNGIKAQPYVARKVQ
jgi:hypothetical protein